MCEFHSSSIQLFSQAEIKSFYSKGGGRLLRRLKNRSGFLPRGSAPALGYRRRERSLVWWKKKQALEQRGMKEK